MDVASTQFVVGQEFTSFESLENAIRAYCKSSCVQLYKRHSRTIRNAKCRCPNRVFNEALKYGEIDYACIHGGRTFKSSSMGHRPNQSTFLMGCTFLLKLRASSDGQNLKVTYFDSDHHGHNVSETSVSDPPCSRKLSTNEKNAVRQLLKLDANKKVVQQHEKASTEKNVNLKDLHNLASSSPASSAEDIDTVLKKSEGDQMLKKSAAPSKIQSPDEVECDETTVCEQGLGDHGDKSLAQPTRVMMGTGTRLPITINGQSVTILYAKKEDRPMKPKPVCSNSVFNNPAQGVPPSTIAALKGIQIIRKGNNDMSKVLATSLHPMKDPAQGVPPSTIAALKGIQIIRKGNNDMSKVPSHPMKDPAQGVPPSTIAALKGIQIIRKGNNDMSKVPSHPMKEEVQPGPVPMLLTKVVSQGEHAKTSDSTAVKIEMVTNSNSDDEDTDGSFVHQGSVDSNVAMCSSADCDKEKRWLTRDLQYSLLEEGRLKERIQRLKQLANIDLELLRVRLVTDDEAKAELEKVFNLVKYILEEEVKTEIKEDDDPQYYDVASSLSQLQTEFPDQKECIRTIYHSIAEYRMVRRVKKRLSRASANSPEGMNPKKAKPRPALNDGPSVWPGDIISGMGDIHPSPALLYRQTCGKVTSDQLYPCTSGNNSDSLNITAEKQTVRKREDKTRASSSGKIFGVNEFNEESTKGENYDSDNDLDNDSNSEEVFSNDGMPYVCTICKKYFTTGAKFRIHMRCEHAGPKPFKCKTCCQRFETRWSRKVHMAQHSSVRPFQCDVCSSAYWTKGQLNRHHLIHSKKDRIQCEECGKDFKQLTTLRYHQRSFHNLDE